MSIVRSDSRSYVSAKPKSPALNLLRDLIDGQTHAAGRVGSTWIHDFGIALLHTLEIDDAGNFLRAIADIIGRGLAAPCMLSPKSFTSTGSGVP